MAWAWRTSRNNSNATSSGTSTHDERLAPPHTTLSSSGYLSSRPSSAAMSLRQRANTLDHASDDVAIAQTLMHGHRKPHRTSSLSSIPCSRFDGLDDRPPRLELPPGIVTGERSRREHASSNTWTSSSGGVLSDHDEVNDRTIFVDEYNRLAKKHGIRVIVREDEDALNYDTAHPDAKPTSWFSRKFLRNSSSSQNIKPSAERQLKHKRSLSDISIKLGIKKDRLKNKDLQDLVRLCGASLLYLPSEYAAGSLSMPTCLRATAQYLVQHAPITRGIFRISGSHHNVAALYDHYCSVNEDGYVISGTVRCPTLPDHIMCDVHDVAGAFKRFLSGLPGGILGSLSLFNVFITIQTELSGDPEMIRTKESKLRARMIALAIATLQSQYRRELICAVFGLLCMVGRAAEVAPREDDKGRPLPTSDLMGYRSLGIVFGPILVGDLLEDYRLRIANPTGGLILIPVSPPKSRKERHKKSRSGGEGTTFHTQVDKIKVANSITEMLITHWRDVVRHMREFNALSIVPSNVALVARNSQDLQDLPDAQDPFLRPSVLEEGVTLRKPPDWDHYKLSKDKQRSPSPTPARRISGPMDVRIIDKIESQLGDIKVRKQRAKARAIQRTSSSRMTSGARVISFLSPTVEEQPIDSKLTAYDEEISNKEGASTSNSLKSPTAPGKRPMGSQHPSVLNRRSSDLMSFSDKENFQPITCKYSWPKNISPCPKISATVEKMVQESSDTKKKPAAPEDAQAKTRHASDAVQPTNNAVEPTLARQDSASHAQKQVSSDDKQTSPLMAVNIYLNNEKDGDEFQVASNRYAAIYDLSSFPRKHFYEPQVFGPLCLPQHNKDASASSPGSQDGLGKSRRLGGSEPAVQVNTQEDSRRISKSLHDDFGRCRKLCNYMIPERTRDPLASISYEEDKASLAALAEALGSLDDEVEVARMQVIIESEHLRQSDPGNQELDSGGEMPTAVSKRATARRSLSSRNAQEVARDDVNRPAKSTTAVAQAIASTTRRQTAELPRTSVESKTSSIAIKPLVRSPSKIAALVAKFNHKDSMSSGPFTASGKISPTKSGYSTPARNGTISRGESIVAAYTTNMSSPSRSMRSARSNRSLGSGPRHSHTSSGVQDCSQSDPNASPSRIPVPKRVLRTSQHDSMPLRSAEKATEPSTYLTKSASTPSSKQAFNVDNSQKPTKTGTSAPCRVATPYAEQTPQLGRSREALPMGGPPEASAQYPFPLLPSSLVPSPLAPSQKSQRAITPARQGSPTFDRANLFPIRNMTDEALHAEPSFQGYYRPSSRLVRVTTAEEESAEAPYSCSHFASPQTLQGYSTPNASEVFGQRMESPSSIPCCTKTHAPTFDGPSSDTDTPTRRSFLNLTTTSERWPVLRPVEGPSSVPRAGRTQHFAGSSVDASINVPRAGKSLSCANPPPPPGPPPPPAAQHITPRPQTSLSHPAPLRPALHAGFVHPDSPFRDIFTDSLGHEGSSPPRAPTRSNSVLLGQIKHFQLQLTARDEQIQQLTLKLNARGSVEASVLTEQLKEAKREMGVWKKRAEMAERNVGDLEKRQVSNLLGRALSLQDKPKVPARSPGTTEKGLESLTKAPTVLARTLSIIDRQNFPERESQVLPASLTLPSRSNSLQDKSEVPAKETVLIKRSSTESNSVAERIRALHGLDGLYSSEELSINCAADMGDVEDSRNKHSLRGSKISCLWEDNQG